MDFTLGEIFEVLKNNNLGFQYKTNSCTIVSWTLNSNQTLIYIYKKMGKDTISNDLLALI
jgi:hypothetical protein